MGQTTSIEWTGSTWNPIRARAKGAVKGKFPVWGYHCERISPGCVNCYAERMNGRMLPAWGTGLDYTVPNRDKVEIFVDEAEMLKPLKWKKARKVFVCSMTDLFAEFVSDEMIDRVFAVMALCPDHAFQVLTKRADRMREYWSDFIGRATEIKGVASTMPDYDRLCELADFMPIPYRNVHLGVSVEDQQRADERIPLLLQTPAAVRWVSYEPALGAVDFTRLRPARCSGWIDVLGKREHRGPSVFASEVGLDWIVIGGESGPGARPFDLAWARSAIEQCQGAGVAVFVKQLGAKPFDNDLAWARCSGCGWVGLNSELPRDPEHRCGADECPECNRPNHITCCYASEEDAGNGDRAGKGSTRVRLKDRKGGDMTEWPEDLQVREFPTGGAR